MSQISLPVRIILIGAVVFLAAWFTVLRPKPVEVPPLEPAATVAPKTTALGKAVDKAKAAAGVEPKTQTESPAATTTAPEAKPETPAATAIPAEALAKLPNDVAGALEARKVVVLGVFADDPKPWRPLADDDRYVRNALRHVNRYHGEVFVKHVGISTLSTYGPLVNALHVSQSPAVVVIDGNLKGNVLTGYADRISINQVIADAHDATVEPDIKDAYLRKFNDVCAGFDLRAARWSHPTIKGKKPTLASLDRALVIVRNSRHAVARTAAPTKWWGMRAGWIKMMDQSERGLLAEKRAVKSGKSADLATALSVYETRDATATALDRRFNAAGVNSCQLNRRA